MKIKEKVLKDIHIWLDDEGLETLKDLEGEAKVIDLTLAEVSKVLKQAYQECESRRNMVKKEQLKQDFNQRMDEICLIYSTIFNVSVNKSKQKLGIK